MPHHIQVLMVPTASARAHGLQEFEVDARLVVLHTILIKMGVTTLYSCEGYTNSVDWEDDTWFQTASATNAYIMFKDDAEGRTFTQLLVSDPEKSPLGKVGEWSMIFDHNLALTQGPRIVLRFPKSEIPALEKYLLAQSPKFSQDDKARLLYLSAMYRKQVYEGDQFDELESL